MWLKLLLCALVVAFCTFLGYYAASKYRARSRFYTQMSAFNDRFLNELTYSRRPLSEIVKTEPAKGDFPQMLKRFSLDRDPKADLSYLTAEEKEICREYLSMLGAGDSHAQTQYFSSCRQTLGEKKAQSVKEAKERGGLYLKLGLLAGLAFVILIV